MGQGLTVWMWASGFVYLFCPISSLCEVSAGQALFVTSSTVYLSDPTTFAIFFQPSDAHSYFGRLAAIVISKQIVLASVEERDSLTGCHLGGWSSGVWGRGDAT